MSEGRINHLSATSINNHLKASLHDYRCELAQVVSIDEVDSSVGEDKYTFVIGDPVNGLWLDVLSSRTKELLELLFSIA